MLARTTATNHPGRFTFIRCPLSMALTAAPITIDPWEVPVHLSLFPSDPDQPHPGVVKDGAGPDRIRQAGVGEHRVRAHCGIGVQTLGSPAIALDRPPVHYHVLAPVGPV